MKPLPILLILIALVLAACSGPTAEPELVVAVTDTLTPTVTPLPPTATPRPPTVTPEPPTPTATPTPTLPTPKPTSSPTPKPAATPTLETALPSEAFMTLLTISRSLYHSDDYEMALAIYSEMLSHGPDPLLYSLRADTFHQLGNFESAIADYLAAYDLGTRDAGVMNNLCWNLAITGQPELALPYCEEAVAADPQAAYRDSRGVCYGQLGMSDQAIADFQAVVDDLAGTTSSHLQAIAALRQTWLTALQEGDNPFTPQVLAELRDESRATTGTTTPEPVTAAPSRAAIQQAAKEMDFTFGDVQTIAGQEVVMGMHVEGSCMVFLGLTGSEADLTGILIEVIGCSENAQSGAVYWLMDTLLPGKREKALAIVYMVMDVYDVIEGEHETTGEKEIGNVIFEVRWADADVTALEVAARFKE